MYFKNANIQVVSVIYSTVYVSGIQILIDLFENCHRVLFCTFRENSY